MALFDMDVFFCFGMVWVLGFGFGVWHLPNGVIPNNFCFHVYSQNSCFGMTWHGLGFGICLLWSYLTTFVFMSILKIHVLVWHDMVWHGLRFWLGVSDLGLGSRFGILDLGFGVCILVLRSTLTFGARLVVVVALTFGALHFSPGVTIDLWCKFGVLQGRCSFWPPVIKKFNATPKIGVCHFCSSQIVELKTI